MTDLTETDNQLLSQSSTDNSLNPIHKHFIVEINEHGEKEEGSASMNDCFRFMLKDNVRKNRQKALAKAQKKPSLLEQMGLF